jgi:hypothetical protein
VNQTRSLPFAPMQVRASHLSPAGICGLQDGGRQTPRARRTATICPTW